jgi:DNA-binding HxlR family transcriptional regulator
MKRLRARYGCPVELAIDMIGGKWKTVILAHLKEEPCRYNELRRKIPDITDKILSEKLRNLAELELIERRDEGPYRLTPLGESLRPVLDALYGWGLDQAGLRGVKVGGTSPRDE